MTDKTTEPESVYAELQKKYNLPDYEEMNWEYEIGNIEEDELVIRNVRKKVTEKIDYIMSVLSNIIQPDTEIATLHETSFFEDNEKEEIILLYKKLMYYYRYASKLVIIDTEKENAEFIKEAHQELKKMMPQFKKIFEKLRDTWKKDLKKTVDAAYFG